MVFMQPQLWASCPSLFVMFALLACPLTMLPVPCTAAGVALVRRTPAPQVPALHTSAQPRGPPLLLSAEARREIHNGCERLCGEDVDATCIPECEVAMYHCEDISKAKHTHDYKACKLKAKKKARMFRATWNEKHSYLVARKRSLSVMSAEKLLAIHDKCDGNCGEDVDSSCVPECEVAMYQCQDFHSSTQETELEECEAATLETAKNFAAEWDKKHPYLLLRRKNSGWRVKNVLSAKARLDIYHQCTEKCGKGVDSSCHIECEVQMYDCNNHNKVTDVDEHKACQRRALEIASEFAATWSDEHPYFLLRRQSSAASLGQEARWQTFEMCDKMCGNGVDSTCVPECEVALYWCEDHDLVTSAEDKKDCEAAVLKDAQNFGAKWDSIHPYHSLVTVLDKTIAKSG